MGYEGGGESEGVCGGVYVACSFRMLKINLLELLLVFMVLIMIVMEGSYGMRWLGYSIGGTCLGALL